MPVNTKPHECKAHASWWLSTNLTCILESLLGIFGGSVCRHSVKLFKCSIQQIFGHTNLNKRHARINPLRGGLFVFFIIIRSCSNHNPKGIPELEANWNRLMPVKKLARCSRYLYCLMRPFLALCSTFE
jgi:hypothetical protein